MPHIIVEYSENLEGAINVPDVLLALHEGLIAQGIDKARIKSRAIKLAQSYVGEAPLNEGKMLHITLNLLEGRTVAVKQQYGQALHKIAKQSVESNAPECSVTLEVRDMNAQTYILK